MKPDNGTLTRVLLVALAAAVFSVPARAQSAAWLDPAWTYRSAVTLTNGNGASLANFQVRIDLGSSFDFGNTAAGGSDLRFTAADGTTLLPYWIEKWDSANRQAIVWVRVSSIPVAGTVVYLYYGNPAATAASNGANTFEFFDDFEGGGSGAQGYWALSPPQTVLPQSQSWEAWEPHTLSVVEANTGGYKYWGYYGLHECGGIGLARSNDLVNWTKYTGNPLIANGRWASVLFVNGTYYMLYETDYCTDASYIRLATSSDGIHFTDIKTIVAGQSGLRNQNANLWHNPTDGKYYIYWYRGDNATFYEIRARSAGTIEGLDDTSSEVVVLSSPTTLAAPNMLYYGGTYFLSTETRPGAWTTDVFASTTSPTSGFQLLPGNPILGDGAACMFQHVFGTTLHNYTCQLTGTVWSMEHRTADLTQPRTRTYALDPGKWTASGGSWSAVQATQQDGSPGTVAQGSTTGRDILSASYTGADYVLEAYGRQIGGRVWGLGARAGGINNLYTVNLYEDLDSSNNLYVYSWVNNPGPGSTATLGAAATGQVNPNAWYKLTVKVHGSAMEVLKDGVPLISTSDSSLPSGGIGLYGESGTQAQFNDVRVRKYAASEPVAAVGTPITQQGLTSLTLTPANVLGASTSQGTIVLASPAPTGGASVAVSSSDSSIASVPPGVTVQAGLTSANFTVDTSAVSATRNVTITASYSGASRMATLTVRPPAISAIIAGSIVSTGATISWTTDVAADSQVEYGTTTAYGSATTLNPALVTSHSVALSGLTANTLYHFRVRSKDAAGNLSVSADSTFTTSADATPVISAVAAGSITVITWTTDKPADSQVEYGATTAYGLSSGLNTAMTTSHSVALSGLTANTLYHFRVRSKDAGDNLAVSADSTFTTAANTIAAISAVAAGPITPRWRPATP